METIQKFWNEESILSIEKLVEWKRKRNSYNFKKLPETVIIDGFGNNKKFSIKRKRKLKGLKGSHVISSNKQFLISSNIGNGAADLITVCEELRCLGVKNFIFVGVGGMITDDTKEGNCVVVDLSISGVGTTKYYSENEEFKQVYSSWTKKTLKNISYTKASCFSTDAPFRETKSLLAQLREKKIQYLEMEVASLFAFSEFYSLNSLCFLFGADRITDIWNSPKNFEKTIKAKQELIRNLIES